MPAAFPTEFSLPKILLNRTARHFLWPRPALYFPIGILRKRGNVFRRNVDLYISGYPRSGNTFARTTFLSANPGLEIRSHRHIPTFVLQLVRRRAPGLILIRRPLDAAISWAIHENQPIEEAMAYWNDYYQALMPVRSQLFVADFEDVISDFGGVMRAFNARWRTSYTPFEHTRETAAECFQVTEEEHRLPEGGIREMQVCRPSESRRMLKEALLREMAQSSFLRRELASANELYRSFLHYRNKAESRVSARLVPERADRETFEMGAPI
jgi:hypothetical protein